MQKTVLWVIAAIIVIGGGYYYMTKGTSSGDSADTTQGSVKPDTRLVVGESIMGKWQDTTDAKFVREFKNFDETSLKGEVVDWYEGKAVSSGTYEVYTKEQPAQMVGFPLEDNASYLRLTMTGTQADSLNFKVRIPSERTLELTYMERGGVSTYTEVL